MEHARSLFLKDYAVTLKKKGVLEPSRNKDPINPPWLMFEYEAMEEDTAKYFLYYAAIRLEMEQWKASTRSDNAHLTCMVVGAGRGRLVDYCVECLRDMDIDGLVYVAECNRKANTFLRQRYKDIPSVKVLPPIPIRTEDELKSAAELGICDALLRDLMKRKPIALIVSELLGSFADNECVSEIVAACASAFGSADCKSIPRSYETYMCAVHSRTLEKYFVANPRKCMYILGLPSDTVFLTELEKVYANSCAEKRTEIEAVVNLGWKPSRSTRSVIGMAGYFRAHLGHDIVIDTTPTPSRNTFFWETAFFPLPLSASAEASVSNDKLTVSIKRKAEFLRIDNSQKLLNVQNACLKVVYCWTVINHNDVEKREHCDGEHVILL